MKKSNFRRFLLLWMGQLISAIGGGCEDNPECDFMSWQKPSDKKCPVCASYMVEKGSKLVCSQETCGYVEQKKKEEN